MKGLFGVTRKKGGVILILDENEKLCGTADENTFADNMYGDKTEIGQICNRNYAFIRKDTDIHMEARSIFCDSLKEVYGIPVIDNERNVYDLMTRERAFYKDYYQECKLTRMRYAYCIWEAASEAKKLGYDKFSVIEFGVAGGSGLINCEMHIKEISRLFDIDIELFGFDNAAGLPDFNTQEKKNIPYRFKKEEYVMEREKLEKRIEFAKIVYGDVAETLREFVEVYHPAPVGVMLIDVDLYESTLPILEFIGTAVPEIFLPRIMMYFDDIYVECMALGENVAIKEFNEKYVNCNISPEELIAPEWFYYRTYQEKRIRHIKMCHLYKHEKYNTFIKGETRQLPLKERTR